MWDEVFRRQPVDIVPVLQHIPVERTYRKSLKWDVNPRKLETEDNHSPFNAPKHEKATMKAKNAPPRGPNRARPKSMATVLLSPTISYKRTFRTQTRQLR